jgi:hypothetical protein
MGLKYSLKGESTMSVETLIAPDDSLAESLAFTAADVTGTHTAEASVPRALPAHAVAESLVASMSLPKNVPYALRDESTGAYLDDARPIGEQIGPAAKVTVTPKTHLG